MRKSACDSCHRKKIQCDSDGPGATCDWCNHHGLRCTFERAAHKRKSVKQKTRRSRASDIAARLELLELAIAQNIPRQSIEQPPPPETGNSRTESTQTPEIENSADGGTKGSEGYYGRDDATDYALLPASDCISINGIGQVQYNHLNFGARSFQGPTSFFSEDVQQWIASRSGETVALNYSRAVHEQGDPAPPAVERHQNETLPDKEIVELMLEEFISSVGKLVFPIVDGVLFKDTIALAYDSTPDSVSRHLSAKASVWAFLATVDIFKNRFAHKNPVDGNRCASLAHSLLPSVVHDRSITGLQTYMMLHLYFMSSGSIHEAELLHSLACRLVCSLGGHINQPMKRYGSDATPQERKTRQIRILFWMCYIFDKDIALRHGQSPLLNSQNSDITIPDEFINYNLDMQNLESFMNSKSTNFDDMIPYLPGDPRLSFLKEKVQNLLYSPLVARKGEAQILYDIRQLDGELESWRLSLPSHCRPSLLVFDVNCQPPKNVKMLEGMRSLLLHLDYYYLLSLIHRASERCLPVKHVSASAGAEWNEALQSSSAIALEASRSIIMYLRMAAKRVASESFWVIIFYPGIALMALFFNILNRPLDPYAKVDLQLLSAAVDLIRNLPGQDIGPAEGMHRKIMNRLASECLRLAQCAIVKAGRERLEGNEQGM